MSVDLEQCACCDHFSVGSNEDWEICAVCFWEQDPLSLTHPDFPSGANHGLSLREARRNFEQFGACAEQWVSRVLPVGKRNLYKLGPSRFEHVTLHGRVITRSSAVAGIAHLGLA
ncbi:hypothetical protein ABIE53_000187 [Burkholderia sp. OAS925]|uniref:CPCC family cysteine-rich protein n=1 Tax=Paraburkholderia sp. OAS925 TaxID=2663827 RepID=UPI001789E7BB